MVETSGRTSVPNSKLSTPLGEEDFNTNWESEIDKEACKKGVTITDYLIEQKFLLMPPEVVLYGSGGENPYFEKLSQISFGKVEKVKKSGRPVTVFRKRKWDELEPDQHETVRKLKVEEAKYKVIFEEK